MAVDSEQRALLRRAHLKALDTENESAYVLRQELSHGRLDRVFGRRDLDPKIETRLIMIRRIMLSEKVGFSSAQNKIADVLATTDSESIKSSEDNTGGGLD